MTTDPETAPGLGAGHVSAEDLSAYVDGELTHQDRVAVEAHLASCRPCRDELAALSWTVEFARAMPRTQVPPGVSFRIPVGEPVSLDDHPGRTGLSVLAWGSMAVAAAAVVLAVLQARPPTVIDSRTAAALPSVRSDAAASPTEVAQAVAEAEFAAPEGAYGGEIGGAGDVTVDAADSAAQSAVLLDAEQVATETVAARSLNAGRASTNPTAEPVRVPSGPRAAALVPQSEANSAARWFAVALGATALAAAAFALGRRSRS